MFPHLNKWHSTLAWRVGYLQVTTHTSAGTVWYTAESSGVDEATTNSTKAPVNEYEIAGCQAEADAVMRYYLPWQPK